MKTLARYPLSAIHTLLLGFVLLAVTPALAAPFQNFPGSIPLRYERQAASDLEYNGRRLFPDEARALYESGVVRDLTDLDPIATSVIWKNEFPKGDFQALDQMGLDFNNDELEYISEADSPVGRFGFIASKKYPDGQIRSYQLLLDVKAHNVLLRKTLLRKIGYHIPPTGHLANFRLRFKGAYSKREFIKQIDLRLQIEKSSRWVVAGADTDDGDLVLQDVLVFEGVNDPFYNLARGDMASSFIQGRRLFNSLIVPFALTDLPESVNFFSWDPGKIFNDQLILPIEDAKEFTTPFEDARWILRRILRLERSDWEEVVSSAGYPAPVAGLVLEKLIARRNFLSEKLKLKNKFSALPVNSEVTMLPDLKKGKLLKEAWDGYASHFAGKDPDLPLSDEEIWGLFKSKSLSNLILNLVEQFNERVIPHTDIAWKMMDRQLDVAAKQFADFVITGQMKKIPFGVWAIPYYDGNLIASREVIAGSYMGSENMVQIADVIGVAVDAGAKIGADGLPARINVAADAHLSFVKTYTHLKPIRSIKASLKEPFRNMVVPWLKHNQANPLDEILKLESLRGQIPEDEFLKKIEPHLEDFQKRLGIGESLIIQTSIAPSAWLSIGYGFNNDLQAYATFSDKLTSLMRLHIYRKDKNTVQVYRDPATYNVFDLSFGLTAAGIQVLDVGWAWFNGVAKTEFFELSLDPDAKLNPSFFENIAAIRKVLRFSRIDKLRKIKTPWVIAHYFDEKDLRFDLLWWRFLKSYTTDKISITHPLGAKKDFIRRTIGKRFGADFESIALESLNSLTDEYFDKEGVVDIKTNHGNDPANTFKGRSASRQVVLEGEVLVDGSARSLDQSSLNLSVDYRWNGWDISKKKAQNILNKLTDKYGNEIFPAYTLTDTKEIQFYSIEMTISFYKEAIDHMLSLDDSEISRIFRQHGIFKSDNFRKSSQEQFAGYLRHIAKARAKGDIKKEANKLAKLVNHAESTLKFAGLLEAIGGQDQLYAHGVIRGFRVGDEKGDRDVLTHTLGRIGSLKPSGPLKHLQGEIGIGEGELLIYWLLNKL
ncbi:MAG: hypothetical protein AABZ06_10115 [Bdellovibrionota bacterium]